MSTNRAAPLPGTERFLQELRGLVPAIAADADREDGFPRRGFDLLRHHGVLAAGLPEPLGGLDLGTDAEGPPAAEFFRILGQAGIAYGRLVEGHVNALRLVRRCGTADQFERAAASAREGILFALWVTDGDQPLEIREHRLAGGKAFCSGAGHAGYALVTAREPSGETRLRLVPADGIAPGRSRSLAGVRGAVTADMDFDGRDAGDPIGAPGDYLRQPEFSAGAWRGSAVACGALEAVTALTIARLAERHRLHDPHQAARIGRLLIARDTAIAWVDRASRAAEADAPGEITATVNLARIAVEAACLDAIPLAQRSLGLEAFAQGTRIERVIRDLSTYLRQPAPDETLVEAALWFAEHGQTA